ncbi:MAG: hypothetical protein NT002_12700 [candidate division Zixibacteria bacterium]|nr:hypothetical protein [candidate division Zixibacteria bacterium]
MEFSKQCKPKWIVAQTTADNCPMISVFEKRGFTVNYSTADSTVELVKAIDW